MRRTKIVCTIGPSTFSYNILLKLAREGMDVARLNFSHFPSGGYKEAREVIKNIRIISKKVGKPIAIIQDLQGPRIRTGDLKKEIKVQYGDEVFISCQGVKDNKDKVIPITYPDLYKDVKKKDRILIDGGMVELEVVRVSNKTIKCKVITGNVIKGAKGINVPTTSLSITSLTEKDKKDLEFGVKNDVDFVALSFVRKAKDVKDVSYIVRRLEKKYQSKLSDKKFLRDRKGDLRYIKIISKIEKHEAIENFDEILTASDGIMVARGDLAVDIPQEEVPLVQKEIIRKCLLAGKPVITATQMLGSMVTNPRPSRAELSDVANAVLDRTDATMLSEETAIGDYPVKTVEVMDKVAREAELLQEPFSSKEICYHTPSAISKAACKLAFELSASLILAFTSTGFTAKTISRFRPRIPIIALTPYKKVYYQLSLSWGVMPYFFPFGDNLDDAIGEAGKFIKKKKLITKKSKIIIVTGHPLRSLRLGDTNLIKVQEI
ncbi:pyruvate kinase [bacterium (Candidatus Torokbacteria) CG_4_10_14_0_2_um_filter_35_8]|nr:MAG: pyruvate kinase [bacterium (Candidatus Torokbacteria) CG_4_10_14_0_2_um_filter_35_8]